MLNIEIFIQQLRNNANIIDAIVEPLSSEQSQWQPGPEICTQGLRGNRVSYTTERRIPCGRIAQHHVAWQHAFRCHSDARAIFRQAGRQRLRGL